MFLKILFSSVCGGGGEDAPILFSSLGGWVGGCVGEG